MSDKSPMSVKTNMSAKTKYYLACYAIVFIVLLRIGIGWHFLYEGVNKFDPASNFSSEIFLGTAKGPVAELYYWMLPDLDGVQRVELVEIQDENGRNVKTFIQYENAWKDYYKHFLANHIPLIRNLGEAEVYLNLSNADFPDWVRGKVPASVVENIAEMNAAQLTAWAETRVPAGNTPLSVINMSAAQRKDWAERNLPLAAAQNVIAMDGTQLRDWAEQNVPLTDRTKGDAVAETVTLIRARTVFNRYLNILRTKAAELEPEVLAFRTSRDRFLETRTAVRNGATFEQQRRWNQMMGFRYEASLFTRALSAIGDSMQSELGRLADPELAGTRGQIVTAPKRGLLPDNTLIQMNIPEVRIPVVDATVKSRLHVLDLAVTFGLTAIGLCLVLGFCTRLACLGGAVFLVNVLLTTYPVPGVYPPIPAMMGNFMFVSKDTVELLALLVLASVPAGRWCGLDFFLWHYGGKQIVGLFCPSARCTV